MPAPHGISSHRGATHNCLLLENSEGPPGRHHRTLDGGLSPWACFCLIQPQWQVCPLFSSSSELSLPVSCPHSSHICLCLPTASLLLPLLSLASLVISSFPIRHQLSKGGVPTEPLSRCTSVLATQHAEIIKGF